MKREIKGFYPFFEGGNEGILPIFLREEINGFYLFIKREMKGFYPFFEKETKGSYPFIEEGDEAVAFGLARGHVLDHPSVPKSTKGWDQCVGPQDKVLLPHCPKKAHFEGIKNSLHKKKVG